MMTDLEKLKAGEALKLETPPAPGFQYRVVDISAAAQGPTGQTELSFFSFHSPVSAYNFKVVANEDVAGRVTLAADNVTVLPAIQKEFTARMDANTAIECATTVLKHVLKHDPSLKATIIDKLTAGGVID